ncbi:Mdm33 family-domain-containing protein [Mycotypha africana]|uniref:Mdm33 family-domain-containing protein n=1 Tax=Mycotypha africana TaxID=64632 RepID=UPI002301ACE6|nr:Mdm33 family-domain-containing protein [Mycotypha africana]KAI8979101.1 Mdm33 family-domain-containing protein [Mycotypha africana]
MSTMNPFSGRLRITAAASNRIILSQPGFRFRSAAVRSSSFSTHTPSAYPERSQQEELCQLKQQTDTTEADNALVGKAKFNKDTQLQKTLAATKAYLERFQADLKPRLQAYLQKINQASQQLKTLTAEVNDSKEALRKASSMLNELTGYNEIDTMKKRVNHQATVFEATRDQVQEAKLAYEAAIETRSSTQRGINELLQRKHLWTGDDVTKFTELYRLEHAHSQAEAAAKEKYQASEKQMDREYMELARSIMERYHEEQLWSDKIRSVSTYGTWALMVVNLLLFVAVQTIFEPRKRQKLTDRFEELLVAKVNEEEEKFRTLLDEKDKLSLQQQTALLATLNELAQHPLFEEKDIVQTLLQQASSASLPTTSSQSVPIAEKSKEEMLTIPVVDNVAIEPSESSPSFISDEELQTSASFTPLPTTSSQQFPIEESKETLAIPFDDNAIIETSPLSSQFIKDEELRKLASSSPSEQSNHFVETFEKLNHVNDTSVLNQNQDSSSLTLSKNKLILYTLESALAGGLLTAAAAYFFK